MKRELTIDILTDLNIVSAGADADAAALYKAAVESDAPLCAADYLTIRDLTRLSGHSGAELQALLLAMFLAVNEGSICLKFDEASVARKLSLFLDEGLAKRYAGRITSGDPSKKYPELIAADERDYKPLVYKKIEGEGYLYFQKYPRYESELQGSLARLIAHKDSGTAAADPEKAGAVLGEVLEKRCLRRGERPVELNGEQLSAVCLALLKDFMIISGGPGTGKTSIVITILRCLVRLGVPAARMRVTAPTGRAAQRLTDSIRQGLDSIKAGLDKADQGLAAVKESTIHRLLGYNPYRNSFRYNASHPLPADVVIVDEVSMIDIVLMARLFEALAPGTKVILLGDKDQLPSVEAGAVLADLMPKAEYAAFSDGTKKTIALLLSRTEYAERAKAALSAIAGKKSILTDRLVILKRSYRSGSGILGIAGRVNEQDEGVARDIPALPWPRPADPARADRIEWLDPKEEGRVAFLEGRAGDSAEWRSVLDSWISRFYFSRHATRPDIELTYAELIKKSRTLSSGEGEVADRDGILSSLFAYIEQAKILTFLKRGLYGTYWTNRYISRRIQPLLDATARYGVFAGSPIMITENDKVRELYNGDVGVAVKAKNGIYYAVFRRLGAFIAVPVSELPAWESAFAITVHKSQGSEYDTVFLVLPQDEKNRLLSKEIVYTGLTRARHSVVIYGSRDVLRAAIGRRIERQSGLKLWG